MVLVCIRAVVRVLFFINGLLFLSSLIYIAQYFSGFLPSTFSMYAVTLSSALFLLEKYALAVSVAAVGVIIGWPFSILVVLPVTVCSLIRGGFKRVFLSGLLTSLSILVSHASNSHITVVYGGCYFLVLV